MKDTMLTLAVKDQNLQIRMQSGTVVCLSPEDLLSAIRYALYNDLIRPDQLPQNAPSAWRDRGNHMSHDKPGYQPKCGLSIGHPPDCGSSIGHLSDMPPHQSSHCPICGLQFVARVWMLAHVLNWRACAKELTEAEERALRLEYIRYTT